MKLLENNIEENINDRGFSDDILDKTAKPQSMKEKLDFNKVEVLCSAKDIIKKIKRQTTD